MDACCILPKSLQTGWHWVSTRNCHGSLTPGGCSLSKMLAIIAKWQDAGFQARLAKLWYFFHISSFDPHLIDGDGMINVSFKSRISACMGGRAFSFSCTVAAHFRSRLGFCRAEYILVPEIQMGKMERQNQKDPDPLGFAKRTAI